MKKLKILFLVLIVALVTVNVSAQEVIKPPKYPDGVYTKENTRTRRAIPYPTLREADVMWSKRVFFCVNTIRIFWWFNNLLSRDINCYKSNN